jgi:hypothetical protein
VCKNGVTWNCAHKQPLLPRSRSLVEAMTDDEVKRWEDRYRNVPVEHIQDSLRRGQLTNEQRKFLNDYLDRRRAAERAEADATAKQRFDKSYAQKERHQRQLMCAGWFAAAVSVLGALAAWASVWFQWHSQPTAAPATPPPAVATTSPTEAPAERQ